MEFIGSSVVTAVLLVVAADAARANTNEYNSSISGFIPSSLLRYYTNERVHLWNASSAHSSASTNKIESKLDRGEDNQIQRFGISGYGHSGSGSNSGIYPHSGAGGGGGGGGIVSTYQPVKIDLGGVVLGTLIGLGAILIIPKLAHIFAGGYKRSVESEIETITDVLMKIDKALEENHIDSSACMQRIICSYVQASERNILAGGEGEPTATDNFIHTLSNNSMLSYLLDGTSIIDAVKLGKSKDGEEDSCSSLYVHCPISKSNIMKVVSNLLPS